MTNVKLTYTRILYLKTISGICKKSPLSLARAKDIIHLIEGNEPNDRIRGNANLRRLVDAELLERPARGCYCLTVNGNKALERYENGFQRI